ncbi:MAG: selenocysteine-specific translation elongation factor [Firmicutes bacterium]|nr:selenocysteine-specific translation elongation factor [Bacillota bacterium]
MDAVIIGTAGHVDHGKTALISAITGVDTDRLKEEKERGISIDLGFASFSLSGGRVAGIIDVPGHERFINNMLAGTAGIDLVLLVIDASEGVMAQTREHLNILQLLGLEKGLVVLTKIDLVDEEWLDMVEEEVRGELRGTFLQEAPFCRVSAVTGSGIEELRAMLDRLTRMVAPRDLNAPMRLPVDRSFIISGFGTIVTGTLIQGRVGIGDIVEVLPAGEKARVRNIEVFNHGVKEAFAGHRVAINLSGVEKSELERGSVICSPGYFRRTSMLDASVTILNRVTRDVKNLDPLHLYLGTSRVVARMAILDKEILRPGERGLVQLRLESPLVADRKDRFIIRSYSPVVTIGGGMVLDPFSERRPRRARRTIIKTLRELEREILTSGTDRSYVVQKISQLKVADFSRLETMARLGKEKLESLIGELKDEGKIMDLGGSYITAETLEKWEEEVTAFLDDYHRKHPLLAGVPRAQLRGVIPAELSIREYDAFLDNLEAKGVVSCQGEKVCRAGFVPELTPGEEIFISKIKSILSEARFQPPPAREIAASTDRKIADLESLLEYMSDRGWIIKISEDMYLLQDLYEEALEMLRDHFRQHDRLTMAQFRDCLQSSRKYMQALLEHFDQKKYTKRVGDYRVPWKL